MAMRAELTAVIPVLPARDVSEAVRFYVERLGFEVVFQDSDDRPQYAGIRRGAVELHLQFQFEKDFEAGTAGQAMLRLVVDDPGLLFQEYKGKGVVNIRSSRGAVGRLRSSATECESRSHRFTEYLQGVFHERTQLCDTSWGTREFAFWDLNHNGLTFMRDL
jgi:catechol 2,3-dioxygenase-like lactoylglutathione lyase family enzyme